MGEWQSIESAPKDGSMFLGYFGADVMLTVYLTPNGMCFPYDGEEEWMMPTCWMPLPPSPPEDRLVDDVDPEGREGRDE